MTDEMRGREEAICEVAGIKDIGDLSDGFHTFNQLYYQRMMLFATIVKQNRDRAWKSLRHEDGELCFGGGWFIVGIDTPEGSYTYHYEDHYYSLFDCVELERAKHWDGHTEKDVTRLLSLPALEKQEQDRWIPCSVRPPENKKKVLVSYDTEDGKKVDISMFDKYGCLLGLVSAWRPLPAPYQEDEA